MRRAIDTGVPLVPEFTKTWGVAPRVVRQFVGKTPSIVGERWVGNAQGLARILDTLPQELLPGDVPEQWDQFNKTVALAQRLSNELPWKSPAALAWLRERARSWLQVAEDGSAIVAQKTELIAFVQRLRWALVCALELEVEDRCQAKTRKLTPLPMQFVDDLLISMLRKGKLSRAAARFDREIKQPAAAQTMEVSFLLGKSYWPLFPGEFVSSDNSRRVVGLTEAKYFRAHAASLNICLWSNTNYTTRCRQGNSFVLAFFEAATGEPQSTAEISLAWQVSEHRYDLHVVQHTGPGNQAVSSKCARALAEVLRHCDGIDVRRHIERGQQLVADVERGGAAKARRRADLAQVAPPLRAALGSAFYEAAIEHACSATTLQTSINQEVSAS